ncbi:MAG TPA: hypothetical protein VKD72_33005 [Gemmataceae bacterium]|nr:hypothetical protein [Gemmataceae bacterium]
MARPLIVCALILILPCIGVAADPPAATETVIKLTVQPAAAPKPALKYQLLPELREMSPGNPVMAYMKCFAEQNNFYYNKEAIDDREKWQTVPLKDLPAKDLLTYGGSSLRQADLAARLTTPDWQILLQARKEGYRMLLPEIQQMRMLAGALKVRFRAQVAEHKFDDAVASAKTMFALSHHLGEHPTFICELVGAAVANITIGPLEEMIEQPGSPNLYWALTHLPEPFIDLRNGFQGERMMSETELAMIDEKERMSEAQLKAASDKVIELLTMMTIYGEVQGARQKVEDWLKPRLTDEKHVQAARKRLVENGLAEEQVKGFSALQVILIDEKHAYQRASDEVMKTITLPYWQAESVAPPAWPAKEGDALFGFMMPTPTWRFKVRLAQVRLDQRLAMLRIVEALRLHAVQNDGRLPAQLSDVKVPLPVDPFNGKPFVYKLDGQAAVLQGTPPKGEEKNASYNLRYEVTLRK